MNLDLSGLDGAVRGWLLPALVLLPLTGSLLLLFARRLGETAAAWLGTDVMTLATRFTHFGIMTVNR